jgi:predicted dehydrogenase/threonine dehydrogenase-like Zn-dependent dehydrogenase
VKQVLLGQGGVRVEDVPAPLVEPGAVLVRVSRSCISVGTEMSGVRESNLPLWKRALRRPAQVKRLIEVVATEGVARDRVLVETRMAALQPTGYSAMGTVIEVGAGVGDLAPGDRVACAGAQSALHAEIIRVSRNLVVPVPEALSDEAAATVTLGAIALQGVRRAQPTLGETFVVIGLGLLGQLTQQILQANGCQVIGIDLDRRRIDTACGNGLAVGIHPDEGDAVEQAMRLTGGVGADGVILTASTPSSEPVSQAFRMCRRKARVVVVGDVGLALDRADIYAKELDFLISTSYGPGRYDRTYEEAGLDYPLAYVRWTENRNMEAYLQLLAAGRLRVDTLVERVYPLAEAGRAYAALGCENERPLAVLLAYPADSPAPARRIANPAAKAGRDGALRVALVGPGGFAMSTYVPILQGTPDAFSIRAVVARQGHSAASSARQLGAAYASTDIGEALADAEVDAVMITTRHDLHGPMVLRALEAGKHVLVEKPLCLTRTELDAIASFYAARGGEGPLLMTGFNRRFSPFAEAAAAALSGRSNPMMIDYRVNAGHIPLDNWVHGPEGGGRNRGEACHFYDLFTFLTGSRVAETSARAIRPATAHYAAADNFVASLGFADGSVATLTYTALGARDHPKERAEIFADGKVLTIDDYCRFTVAGARHRGIDLKRADKGHKTELLAFARAVRDGGDWPIPLWQQVQATEIALAVDAQILRPAQEPGMG